MSGRYYMRMAITAFRPNMNKGKSKTLNWGYLDSLVSWNLWPSRPWLENCRKTSSMPSTADWYLSYTQQQQPPQSWKTSSWRDLRLLRDVKRDTTRIMLCRYHKRDHTSKRRDRSKHTTSQKKCKQNRLIGHSCGRAWLSLWWHHVHWWLVLTMRANSLEWSSLTLFVVLVVLVP